MPSLPFRSILVVLVAATATAGTGCASLTGYGGFELRSPPSVENTDRCSLALADAIDAAERRGRAGLTPEAVMDPSRLGDLEARAGEERIRSARARLARRLMRQGTEIRDLADRLTALDGLEPTRREHVARAMALRASGATGLEPLTDGGVRTDFAAARVWDASDLAYLTLSEMDEPADSASADEKTRPEQVAEGKVPVERGPLPGFGETVWRDVKRIHLDLWKDTKRVYGNPTNAVILLTAGGASLALRPEVDDDIEDYYRDHHTMSEGWRETFGVVGNPAFHFALAGTWYLAGQRMQDAKTYEVGKTLFSALIINGVSTSVLKLAACTDGPNGESFAWPSGHTSSAFTVAAVLHQSYGHWVGIPLYGAAGMVGLARLDDREHHFSDVVFGAAMGLVIGHTVASGHRPQIFGGDIVPYADSVNGSGGVAWIKATK